MLLKLQGFFDIEHRGKKYRVRNSITVEGRNSLLNTGFHGGSQITTWYLGLINNTPTPVLLEADSLASHTGWVELVPATDYTGNRPAWNEAAAADGDIGASSGSVFNILTTKTVYGLMLCSVSSGTSGVLWCTGAFDDPIDLANGDTLTVSYGIETSG